MRFTEAQTEAIFADNGELLVSAAAGSGKTAVLVERILHMIEHKGMSIDRMLIVTFTRAAASELRERLELRLSEAAEKTPASWTYWRSTSIPAWSSRRHEQRAGELNVPRPFQSADKAHNRKNRSDKKEIRSNFCFLRQLHVHPAVTYVYVSSLGCKYSFLGWICRALRDRQIQSPSATNFASGTISWLAGFLNALPVCPLCQHPGPRPFADGALCLQTRG